LNGIHPDVMNLLAFVIENFIEFVDDFRNFNTLTIWLPLGKKNQIKTHLIIYLFFTYYALSCLI
jgi:hypothetical protein